jgi:predicted Zn-dependent peptidase
MLGGPAMNSRLNIQLREKNGIAYNLESNYQSFSDTGLFSVYCGTENALLEKAISLINKEMNRFREARLSTNQLHIAKQQLKGQLCISLEAQQNEMLSMGKNLLLYHRVDTIEDIFAKIDSVTADQILETANQIFDPRQMSMLIFKNS